MENSNVLCDFYATDATNEYQKYDSDETKYELVAKNPSCWSLHVMIVKC